jgi:heme-degrading monooxygenase HmoA
MLTHIVCFKLKDGSPEQARALRDKLAAMEGKIPELLHIEVGIDVVRSERSYDVVLVTKFRSLEDLRAYQAHPEHLKVLEYINTVKESTISVDYES